jgi:hypothetical protein
MFLEKRLRQANRFASENENSVPRKLGLPDCLYRKPRKEEERPPRYIRTPKTAKRPVDYEVEIFPVIESSSLQTSIVQPKAHGFHEMERCAGGYAGPADVAGIPRDIGMYDHNIHDEGSYHDMLTAK